MLFYGGADMTSKLLCVVAFLAGGAPAVSAAQPQTFNLECAGSTKTETIAGTTTEPYRWVYRVDLTSKQFCTDDCETLTAVAKVDAAVLTLWDRSQDGVTQSSLDLNEIDRRTGRQTVRSYTRDPRDDGTILIRRSTGDCRLAPFGGFPTFKTMF